MNRLLAKGSTLFLKAVLLGAGLLALAICVFALPGAYRGGSAEFPYASLSVLLIVTGLYATTVPFFIALWQTFKLLTFIDRNTAFSEQSVRALRVIKRCAIAISVVYVAFVPLLFPIADADDAPGLILIGTALACLPIAVAVFAAILERLLRSAIALQSENELTV